MDNVVRLLDKNRHKWKRVLNLKEIQDIEYNILCKTVSFFEENNIQYLLAGGTLLGAVRHGGFIPWDDDIDILIPRADYERLKRLADQYKQKYEELELKLPELEGYPYPYIKAVDTRTQIVDHFLIDDFELQVYIDLFPLDHYPDKSLPHAWEFIKTKFLKACLEAKIKKNGLNRGGVFVQCVLRTGYHILGGYKGLAKRIDKRARKMDKWYQHSKHYGNGAWPENMKDYFSEQMLFPVAKKMFVDREFNIPENYDAYLLNFYGDYMTPPPEDKRARHSFDAYWTD